MTVRVGFVGCGGMNSAHMRSLARLESAQLVAFSDPDLARAQSKAEEFEGRAYESHEAMLEAEALDAIYVAVPPFAHTTTELMAAEKGCAVFVEKPVATTLEKALEINEGLKKAGVVTQVGYHWRWFDTTEQAAALLPKDQVHMALGYWNGGFPGVAWWRVLAESGGQFVEQTTHIFDLARYLVGEVKQVGAFATLRAMKDTPNMDVPDVGVATLEFESGAIGTVMNTCALTQGHKVGLALVGHDLVVEHNAGQLLVIKPEGREEVTPTVNPVEREDEVFIQAVKTGDTSAIRSSYEDGVKSLAVSLAVNEAWQKGKVVEVPRI